MSALAYLLHDDCIVVATDSLASQKGLGPLKYANKIYYLPFLKTILTGTGLMDLVIDWYCFIQKFVVINDITGLNKITERKLPDLYSSFGEIDDNSSTIYQFGYCERIGKHIGFAYRSINGFRSEELIPSIGLKPSENIKLEESMPEKDEQFEQYILRLIIEQKRIDDMKSSEDRLGIGGNIYYSVLQKNEFNIKEIYEFPYKTIQYQEMVNKIRISGSELF